MSEPESQYGPGWKSVRFIVPGPALPQPETSKKVYSKRTGALRSSAANMWKGKVIEQFRKNWPDRRMVNGPVILELDFVMRKTSPMRAGTWHTATPRLIPLVEAVVSALDFSSAWQDITQLVGIRTAKSYADGPGPGGVAITIWFDEREVVHTNSRLAPR